MDCGQIQEDLFSRQLWDLSSYPESIAWSLGGSLAAMTNDTILVQTTKFEYMAAYKSKWVTLDRKPPPSQPDGKQADRHATLTDWLHDNDTKEGNTHFLSVNWCNTVRNSQDQSPLLTILLTDGTLLFVSTSDREAHTMMTSMDGEQVSSRSKDGSYPVEYYTNTSCTLNMHGMSVCFDCSSVYKNYCDERHLNILRQRIRCSASCTLLSNADASTDVLIMASHDRVTFWHMHYSACDGSQSSSDAPCSFNARGERVQLNLTFLSECILPVTQSDSSISALLVCNTNRSNANSTKDSVHVLCGTNDGEVFVVRFGLALNPAGSSASTSRAVIVAQSLLGRHRICDTPISSMHLLDANHGNSAGGMVCFVSGVWVQTAPVTALIAPSAAAATTASTVPASFISSATALVSKGSINGLTVIPSACSGASEQSHILVCSTFGELRSYAYTPTPALGASSAATTSWKLHSEMTNKANGYSMFGVAADPTGLMSSYMYRTPAIHYNTREVQLNNSLRSPRSAIAFVLSPFVAQDFAASVTKTASVFLHIIRSNAGRADHVSLAALPLAFLQSLECDASRTYYRSKLTDLKGFEAPEGVSYYPAVKGTETVKKEGSAADSGSDSGDEEGAGSAGGDQDSDSEDSVTMSQQGQTVSPRNFLLSRTPQQDEIIAAEARAGKSKFAYSNGKHGRKRYRRRVSNMSVVYERVEQLARPSKQEAVQLAVETVFDAAVMVALTLQADAAASEIRADMGEILGSMDLDQKIEVLFSLPMIDDTSALDSKTVLWQCVHLLLLALHRTVGVIEIGADYEHLPSSLRQVMHRAHCIRALQRLLVASSAPSAAATDKERTDLQSVYFMTLVLTHHLSSLSSTDPSATPLRTLVHFATQRLQTSSRQHSQHSSAATVNQRFDSEMCALCAANVEFVPFDDFAEETPPTQSASAKKSAPQRVKGGSVLFGTCNSCTMRAERCCFSLRLITTSAKSCGISVANGVEKDAVISQAMCEKVYHCELCSAVTSMALYSTVTAPGSMLPGSSSMSCPYCSISMQPL